MKIISKLLKQPLNLGMFVPCDLEGNYLEEPEYSIINYGASPEMFKVFEQEQKEFKEAKNRVIFEGFNLKNKQNLEMFSILSNNKIEFNYDDKYKTFEKERFYFETIEDVIGLNIELNQTVKKQLSL